MQFDEQYTRKFAPRQFALQVESAAARLVVFAETFTQCILADSLSQAMKLQP